jgi:hypothetical protein
MYVHSPFSSHNSIATGNIFILLFSPINDNFNFSWNYYLFITIIQTALLCIMF